MTGQHDREPAASLQDRLREAESELAGARQQAAELTRELEETNRGLIAFHRELEAARQAEAQLAAIVRSSDDAMVSMTPDLVITSWNPAAERLFGYSAAEVTGRRTALIPADLQEEFGQLLREVREGQPRTYDTRRLRKDGSLIDVAVTMSGMRDPGGQLLGYAAVARDITGRLRTEAELAAARARQEVQDDRDRIARDLHDRVIGRVFAAGMSLQGIASLAGRPELTARIEDVIRELDLSISEVREAIFALHRRHTEPAGLRAQVLAVVSDSAAVLGFRPRCSFDGPVDDTPDDVAGQLVPVIREALSNIGRHAHASAAAVRLAAGPGLVLQVSDNGRGMGQTTRSSGLRNMRERAEILGGTFSITSAPGAGTTLEWRIPPSR
jgi:two-component system, NarL family, sensor histidine kinase DevS